MASAAPSAPGVDGYDVYISYPRAELAWAERLARDLSRLGLRCFIDLNLGAGESWSDALKAALDRSGALVVLWSSAAEESKGMLSEIAGFEAVSRQREEPRLIIPVVLGDTDVLRAAPPELSSWQAVFIGREAYAAGAKADSDEWARAVEQIAGSVTARPRLVAEAPPDRSSESAATLPSFSGAARRALTYAAGMLGDTGAERARLRTAALLGALRASALGGMTPTTGDVVRLVLDGQADGRTAEQTLAAAGTAAGLKPIGDPEPIEMSVEGLMRSNVRQLVRDAVEMQQRTGATGVHLRHVLATGVHPAVSREALVELGVTMRALREEWRASIARTWPEESQEAWDDILADRPSVEPFATAPPSARVHADRWTTEDRLDYALYAKAIAEFIRHPDAKPPMVISVQAPWGQGKTSLMRMVQGDLDPSHPDLQKSEHGNGPGAIVEPPSELTFGELRDSLGGSVEVSDTKPKTIRTVWFNAWKYQSSEQIWAGLAHAILAQLSARLSFKDRELFWFNLQRRRIDPSAVRNDIHRAVLERFLPRLAGWAVLALGTLIVIGLSLLAGVWAYWVPGLPVAASSAVYGLRGVPGRWQPRRCLNDPWRARTCVTSASRTTQADSDICTSSRRTWLARSSC